MRRPGTRSTTSTPSHPRPAMPAQIGERLWWGRIPLPMELNHINVWLMDDGDGWTLVDTGLAEDVCREAWGTLDQYLQGRPLRRIFITHDHPDHMGLVAVVVAEARRRGLDVAVCARVGRRIPGVACRRTAEPDEWSLPGARHADVLRWRTAESARA